MEDVVGSTLALASAAKRDTKHKTWSGARE
jgi:hypothetical protein